MVAVLLAAQNDVGGAIMLGLILGALGEGATHLTYPMIAAKSRIRYWAVGLAIITGVSFAFGITSLKQAEGMEDLAGNVFVAVMVGAFSALPWYFVTAVVAFIFLHIARPPLALLGRIWNGIFRNHSRWRDEQERQRRQREYELSAPERARAESLRVSAQKRREDARAACEIFFNLHAPEIGNRFTRAMFDDFVKRHMGDDRTPEYVEERAEQLRHVLQHHLEKTEPPKMRSLEDLAAWFQEQKRQIERLPDGVNKDALRAQLNARYAEMTSQFLEEMRP